MFVQFFKLSFTSYDASCQFVASEALPDWLDIIFTEILVLFLIDMSVFRYVDEPVNQCRDKEALLRERRPNGVNSDELLEMMKDTRAERRAWINKESPTISDILRRYPRLQDLNSAVCTSNSILWNSFFTSKLLSSSKYCMTIDTEN
jgi:hypothetical protein